MSEYDLTISDMKKMQFDLYKVNREKWNDMNPKAAKEHILYMVEEIGECISIIKKKGIDSIMSDEKVRARFVEELSDVLMYYTEVLNRLNISSEELTDAYVEKHNINMKRNYIEENKYKYNN